MTEEQIKQNAEEYILPLKVVLPDVDDKITFIAAIREAFIAGVHSLDEEIKELKEEIESLKENEKELFEGFKKRGTKLGELMKENVKLRNPWISVKERLPEEGKDILLSHDDGIIVRLDCVRIGDINFIKNHIRCYMCWMETPKPELKKGE